MNHTFIEYNQDQQHLLSKDVSDWIEEDSLEQYISDTHPLSLKLEYPVNILCFTGYYSLS